LLPLSGLLGLTLGSLIWGAMADRHGRRPALLVATLLFIATSICGTMPSFEANLLMCFVMGLSAGGLLPVVLTLLTELSPRRHRGFVLVLVAGLGSTGGYLAASGLASLLEPHFGWRVLWLVGLPTGLAMVGVQRLIPESPRFLRLHGREAEAREVMDRYGMRAVDAGGERADAVPGNRGVRPLFAFGLLPDRRRAGRAGPSRRRPPSSAPCPPSASCGRHR
jgi:putative MFS transporter